MKHKILMTLALLLTAVGGAWAQDANYDIDVDFDDHYNPNGTPFDCNIHNLQDLEAEIKGTLDLSVDGDLKGSFEVNGEMVQNFITPALDAGDHTWSAVFKPEEGGEFSRNGNFKIKKAYTSINYNGSTSINMGVGESTELDVYINPGEAGELSYSSSDASVASITKKEYSNKYIIQANAAGTATMTFSFAGSKNYHAAEDMKITVTVLPPAEPAIDVTTNAAEEGATFTEASFEMPTYDVTVNYELVRDMSVDMTTKIGDGKDGYRIRLKKNEQTGKYEPAEMTAQEMKALVKVHDDIENYDLTFGVLDANCIVNIYAANDENQAVGEPIAFADLTPGRYIAKAVAATGSAYEGETDMSNIFVLFEGYEIKVAAGEYATYYKDEALKVEDENAKLYTITAVEDGKAVLSDASEVMPKNTPFLVHNNGTEEKTILLIPCNEPNLAVTVADEFKGTLEATTIEASTDAQANYVFNGKQFVWVKNALTIGANKCWLSIESVPAGIRSISIVFGDGTTGLKEIDNGHWSMDNGQWYDLNGRKLDMKPTQKGVFINNGRKVVIK